MESIVATYQAHELRVRLADVLSRIADRHERIGITRHGRMVAVMICVDDLDALEEFEELHDIPKSPPGR